MGTSIILLCMSFASFSSYSSGSNSPIVTTVHGDVQGSRKTHTNGIVYDEFRGIQFGAPPVGGLRWKKPTAPESWTGVRNVTEWGQKCTQIVAKGKSGENCLYLNVWVPGGVDHGLEPLPVMVYATGGVFLLGSGNWYPGQELATTAKVIVVTFNYRVSTLGFLSTGDENSPGNYGLWDSHAVLLWVNDNIKAFGGDTKRIVMMGQSAGGAISSHFMTSPKTKGLYQRVIAISGTGSAVFGFTKRNVKLARNLGVSFLCPIWSNKAMVDCLRNKDADNLDYGGYAAALLMAGQLPSWIPVQDGDFLTQSPQDALEQGAGADIDLLLGRTEDDGAGIVLVNPSGVPDSGFNLAGTEELLDASLRLLFKTFGNTTRLIAILKEQYPDLKIDDVDIRTKAASQLLTDFAFTSPAYYEAGKHYQNSKTTGKSTYVYNFRYRNSFQGYPSWVNGSHSDDLFALFGEPYAARYREKLGPPSETDRLVSTNVMKYYGNFAHTGNPNDGPNAVSTQWPQYTHEEQYLEISARNVAKTFSDDLKRRIDFWLTTWPTIIEENRRNDNDTGNESEKREIRKAIPKMMRILNIYLRRLAYYQERD